MKKLTLNPNWPENWKSSFQYDQMELYGDRRYPGYYFSYKERFQATINLIQSVIPKTGKILDVAAGQGNFSLNLAELGYRVTWNDLRSDLIDYTKQKYEKGEIEFVPGNILELNFPEKFDLVLITEVIEHVAHPDKFLNKICSLVKQSGYILMTTPNGAYFLNSNPRFSECQNPEKYESIQFKPNSDGHIFLLYPDEIEKLASDAGLEILHFKFISNALTCGHMKLRFILNFLPDWLVSFAEHAGRSLPTNLSKYLHSSTVVLMKRAK